MKTNSISKIIAAALLAGTPLFWTACTDTWDEHYDATAGSQADQPSLLENIKADPQLANFVRVLEAIGQDELLGGEQQLTVWAPKNLTSAQADSVIAVYEAGKAAGLKTEDNKAVTQFFQNHAALYGRPVSSLTNDTVTMLNKKYMHLVGTSDTSGLLNGNAFDDMALCSNGILYKTQDVQTFFPNIREYMEGMEGVDSIMQMIAKYDEYELDEKSSVSGGVKDGKTIYLDSVTVLSNQLLNRLGYIQREDSVYTLLLPTDEVWADQYEQYKKYYVYHPVVEDADSLAEYNTHMSIVSGRFFNTSGNISYNRAPQDSLTNTQYMVYQNHNPRQNVYYHPYGGDGIFSGLERVECSNGEIYIDNKGAINPSTTFFTRNDLPCISNFEVEKDAQNKDKMNTESLEHHVVKLVSTTPASTSEGEGDDEEEETPTVITLSEKVYKYLTVSSVVGAQHSNICYNPQNLLSNVYYNIYIVTVPNSNGLPTWFQVGSSVRNDKGDFPQNSSGTFPMFTPFENPHPVQADGTLQGIDPEVKTVANADVLLKQSKNNTCFVSSTTKIDTILVQKAYKFDYTNVGWNDVAYKMNVTSFGPASSNNKLYTRSLSLCEFIFVPFETEEEALAAADDMDAFNDEILEANKEN